MITSARLFRGIGIRFFTTAPPKGSISVDKHVDTHGKHTGIAILTLSNPAATNALTPSMGVQLQQHVKILKADNTLRAVVITGEGNSFSSGGDFEFLHARIKDAPINNAAVMRDFYSKFLCVRELPVPVLAAVNGAAIGAGLALACATDIRVIAKHAKVGMTFASLGLHPGMASTFFLPQLIGPQLATQMLLTGEVIDGEEAFRRGLCVKSVDSDDVLVETLKLAQKISNASPVAVRSCIRTLRLSLEDGMDRALWREADAQAQSYAAMDIREGLKAVKEKRPPKFEDIPKEL